MARAKKVQHWKHGWIPVSPEAKAYVAGKGPLPGHWTKPVPGTSFAHTRVFVPEGGYRPLRVKPTQAASMMDEIQKNGGFTYDPKTGGLLKVGEAKGFAVAVPGTEEIVGVEKVNAEDITREDFARGVAKVLMKHQQELADGAVLGGWYSPERNQYMVELTHIVPPGDREEAIRLGKERNQEAIFDLSTGETVFTGGTGDAVPDTVPSEWEREHQPTLALSSTQAPLTPEERAAALYYTGPGFLPLNGALRTGEEMSPQVAFYKQALDGALAKHTVQHDATVYRGIKSWSGFPTSFNPGDTYVDPGYMSTAVSDGPPTNYQADVMFQIEVPKGAHALDLNGNGLTHHREEAELLLPAGSQLRILSDTMQFDQRVVHAQVVA